MKVLCYDIGGTDIKYGIVEDGNLIEKASVRTDAALGQQALILRLVHTTREMLKNTKWKASASVVLVPSISKRGR